MRAALNAIGYQIASLVVIQSAGTERPWRGIAACILFIALQWGFSQSRRGDARAMACALLVAWVLDGTWSATGWVQHASPEPALIAPLWITALWLAFAMTFNHSMRWLQGRPWLAAILGAIGSPLAYWTAGRVFSAVVLPSPSWPSLLMLAIGWAMAIPLIAWAAGSGAATLLDTRKGART